MHERPRSSKGCLTTQQMSLVVVRKRTSRLQQDINFDPEQIHRYPLFWMDHLSTRMCPGTFNECSCESRRISQFPKCSLVCLGICCRLLVRLRLRPTPADKGREIPPCLFTPCRSIKVSPLQARTTALSRTSCASLSMAQAS